MRVITQAFIHSMNQKMMTKPSSERLTLYNRSSERIKKPRQIDEALRFVQQLKQRSMTWKH